MGSGPDAAVGEMMSEPVGPLLQLRIGDPALTADRGDPLRHDINGVLDKVGDVEGHSKPN
ncbi:hypothetical protein GCM10029964_099490 [Kibdelosporangium lantanae]